jgi:hypothetical protein
MSDKPVQHKPKHLDGPVADPRHPAASAFAPLQPAAGVVADDADEKGQNLAGGPKASDAEKTYADQPEKLAERHYAARTPASTEAPVPAAPEPAKPAAKK